MQSASVKISATSKQQKSKIAIYCDFQNVPFNAETSNRLLNFAKSKGRLIIKKIYYNSLVGNLSATKPSFENIGYQIIDLTCLLKNSVDNQIKSDVIDDIWSNNSPDVVILVSGDGDFVNLVRDVKVQGKYFIVVAQKATCKKDLKDVACEFHFIDELPQLVEIKNQHPVNIIYPQISYNEAIEYLTQTISTAKNQGKGTGLGYLNQLMLDMFSTKYQGVASISTPDGKKIKSFGQFVDMVVKEGKVRKLNQELLLIE
jgi:uncharacterized LabA/DUF88 family protein